MKTIISGRRLDLSDVLKERTLKKTDRLSRFFDDNTEAYVVLSNEKKYFKVEITIHHGGIIYRAEEASYDMYASINRAVEILERQIRKNRTRLEKKLHQNAFKVDRTQEALYHVEEEEEYKIVKNKKFAIKPMRVQEAILQMNLLGHSFFMFLDEETAAACVVYKRESGDYGLIEAE